LIDWRCLAGLAAGSTYTLEQCSRTGSAEVTADTTRRIYTAGGAAEQC